MQDNIFRFILKKISYLAVFIAFSSQAQQDGDMPSFEDEGATSAQIDMLENEPETTEEPEIADNGQTLSGPVEDQTSDDENTSQNEGGDVQSGNFDVFQPSEEISEDLAVPFPADI